MTVSGTNVIWYDDAKTQIGQGVSYTPNPAKPLGTYTYYVTESSSAGCTSDFSEMTLVISPCSTPQPSAANSEICDGATVPALVATGENVKWYDVAEGGTAQVGNTYTPATSGPGVYTAYVTQTITCESTRKAVTLTINANPTVSVTAAASSVKVTDSPVALTLAPQGGTLQGTGVSGTTFNPAGLSPNVYEITYSYTDSKGCAGSNKVSITVTPAGPDYSYLQDLIDSAKATVAAATIGTENGNYPQSAKDALNMQIQLSNLVVANAKLNNATPEEIAQSEADLEAAIQTFIDSEIVDTNIYATGINVPDALVQLIVGDVYTVGYTFTPADYTVAKPLVWTVDKPEIATVDAGVITAISKGTAKVTVRFQGETTVLALITVYVENKVSIKEVEESLIKVYPTHFESTVTVKGGDVISNITIIDHSGKKIKTLSSDADVIMIDLSDVAIGMYDVVIETISGNIVTKKIVK